MYLVQEERGTETDPQPKLHDASTQTDRLILKVHGSPVVSSFLFNWFSRNWYFAQR